MSKQDIKIVNKFNSWRRGGLLEFGNEDYPKRLSEALDEVTKSAERKVEHRTTARGGTMNEAEKEAALLAVRSNAGLGGFNPMHPTWCQHMAWNGLENMPNAVAGWKCTAGHI